MNSQKVILWKNIFEKLTISVIRVMEFSSTTIKIQSLTHRIQKLFSVAKPISLTPFREIITDYF
jgi:ribosomal protein L17